MQSDSPHQPSSRSQPLRPPSELYLELLKLSLTAILRPEQYTPAPLPKEGVKGWLNGWIGNRLRNDGFEIVRRKEFNYAERYRGSECWPLEAETMIGIPRLNNVQKCVESVLRDGVPGDLIETGVWKGGTTIFMRALLEVLGNRNRRVWVADSFKGVPPPSADLYPADAGDFHHTYPLDASLETVRENFRKYGMLDDRVQFLEGWFKDTLAVAPIKEIAVMRLDGDIYESTMDALKPLYPKLSIGGYCIIDDYQVHKPCAMAVEDYRSAHGITEPIELIDHTAVYWRRER